MLLQFRNQASTGLQNWTFDGILIPNARTTRATSYLKNKVFTTPPENIDVPRQRIIEEFNALRQQPEMIRHVMRGMHRRTIRCVERNGGHVEGHGP